MNFFLSFTDNFVLIAFIIIGIYAIYNYLTSKKSKSWYAQLYNAPDLTHAFFVVIFFAYPFIFLALLKDFFIKGTYDSIVGEPLFSAVFKQLHVDRHDPRRAENKVYFIGWGPLIGLHVPLLLLWIALWIFIVDFILGFFI